MKNKLRVHFKKILLSLLLFSFLLISDRLSKILVLQRLKDHPFHVMPFVDFVYVQNTGVAFGLFGSTRINFTLISFVSILLIIIILFQFFKSPSPFLISLLLAGALGNVWDRLLYGFVVDFIKIGSFYVFNIADSAITLSAVWIILLLFYENRKKSNLPESQ